MVNMKKLFGTIILAAILVTPAAVLAHETGEDHTHSVDDSVIEERLNREGLNEAPDAIEMPESTIRGEEETSGFVDDDGNPISIEDYNEARERETGMQWGNIAILIAVLTVIGGGIVFAVIKLKSKKA